MTKSIGTEYKNCYLIYSRKSTDDTDNQKNSIPYQKMEGVRYAKREHLPIGLLDSEGFCTSGIITERHTGYKEDENFIIKNNGAIQYRIERPKFHKLVELLYNNKFKGVIFLCWDRASRNKTDDNLLRKLMKRGIDIRFVQASYDSSSSGELHMDVDGMFSQHYSRVISEKVTNTNRKMRDEGICTYRAPIGYLNLGDPRKKPFDTERAPIVKQLFAKYANEGLSLHDLARWANDQGLRMPPVRRPRTEKEMLNDEEIEIEPVARPLTFKNVQKILTNRFYIGLIIGNDGQFVASSSHEPLIDEKLFYTVQDMLQKKHVSIYRPLKPYTPYRGLVRCSMCNRVYSPYEKKGIMYYKSTCEVPCGNTQTSFNASTIEEKIEEKIISLYFTEKECVAIERKIGNELDALETRRLSDIENYQRQQKRIREDLGYLHTNKLMLLRSNAYTPDDFIHQEITLNSELEVLNTKITALDISLHEVIKDVFLLSQLLTDAAALYYSSKPAEKELLINKVFFELKISQNGLVYKCKNGFKALENHSVALGDPTGWLFELLPITEAIKSSINDLKV